MCTLSWRRDSEGFELHFNRDERHSRAEARPPETSLSGELRVLAPRDGDFGGSWLGVNERGLALALLNGWHIAGPERQDFRSRGLLVLEALSCPDVTTLAPWLGGARLERYRPFTLCAFDPSSPDSLRADWNGKSLDLSTLRDEDRPLISSSYRYEDVVERRRALFVELAGAEPTREELAAFHASHEPERGPFSTCMHRDDASTKSYTTIRVNDERAFLAYLDSPPCEGGTLHEAALALRGERSR